jgi:Sarcoglycan complex subunit protein
MTSKGEQNLKKLSQTDNSIIYFWMLLSILAILTVGNLILNLCLIGALRIGHGMQNLEVSREMEMLKFGSVDLDRIYKKDGRFEGFNELPMAITGEIRRSIHFESLL